MSSVSKKITELLSLLSLCIVVAFGIVSTIVYQSWQKAPYKVEGVLIQPHLLNRFTFIPPQQDMPYTFQKLEWHSYDSQSKDWTAKSLSVEEYSKVFQLVKKDPYLFDNSEQKAKAQLVFSFQSKQSSVPHLKLVEIYEDSYRVEVEGEYARFQHPNIHKKLVDLL